MQSGLSTERLYTRVNVPGSHRIPLSVARLADASAKCSEIRLRLEFSWLRKGAVVTLLERFAEVYSCCCAYGVGEISGTAGLQLYSLLFLQQLTSHSADT